MNTINTNSKPTFGTRDECGNIALTIMLTIIFGTGILAFRSCNKPAHDGALFVIEAHQSVRQW